MKLQKFIKVAVLFTLLSFWVLLKGVADYFLQVFYVNICKIKFGNIQIPKDDRFELVCISHVSWANNIWQRNHHTMSRFADKYSVLYCCPKQVIDLAKDFSLFWDIKSRYKDLIIYNPLLLSGGRRLPFIKLINRLILINMIKKFIYKSRLRDGVYKRDIVLWFYFPINEDIIGRLNETLIVYDVQDEYSFFPWAPEDIKEREIRLATKADLLFTGTQSLFEKKREYNSNSYFIPCGVDVKQFKKAHLETTALPEEIANIKHPIIGYFGGIDERVDMELLEYMSLIHPECSIVLVGPVREWVDVIPKAKNIYFLGKKEYQTLPNYLKAFDVCMIPFKTTGLAVYTNPTKLLEYMAGGKPVVSTAIVDLKKLYSDVIYIAHNKEEFVKLIEKCIKEKNDDKILKGISISEVNDWKNMVDRMEGLILSTMRQKHNFN